MRKKVRKRIKRGGIQTTKMRSVRTVVGKRGQVKISNEKNNLPKLAGYRTCQLQLQNGRLRRQPRISFSDMMRNNLQQMGEDWNRIDEEVLGIYIE